jgi:Uma2 family endonuclease
MSPLPSETISHIVPDVPPLESGDRLARPEFRRRYAAHPDIRQAELVEGVVYVASPVRYLHHARLNSLISGWLTFYEAATPGVYAAEQATLEIDEQNEVQPDALLRIAETHGGRSHVTAQDYLAGAPELVVEIAASSAAKDLHDKRDVYARCGVAEYLVVQSYDQQIYWFVRHGNHYAPKEPDNQGVFRSSVFPGLWLASPALWAGQMADLLATLQSGLATPEHAAFRERLPPPEKNKES